MLQLRMQFLPYLYAAFVDYYRTGMPPFRGLVMDYPDDPNVWKIDLEYMMGDRVLSRRWWRVRRRAMSICRKVDGATSGPVSVMRAGRRTN